ncbi:serine hydrolase [Algoriphagus yeomjeoni]|uniref:serine hydrolase n=1 Tax=Algoriphagus yeomjeoni TaxID=291403 RepID=UPI003CE48CBC
MKSKLNRSIWLVIITIVFTNCSTQTDPLPDDVTQNIQKRIEYGLNGAIAIGIIDQDGIRYYNFGSRDSFGAEVNEHSIFEIGSISKTFTATLLADQALNGDLKLDDPINELLPDRIKIPVLGKQKITLGHLSDHTSGLPNMPGNFKPANPKNPFADYTPPQMYEFISNYTPTREVGTNFEYSNLAFGLLGHALSLHVGKTYEDLVSEVITGPLGMNETKTTFDEQMIKNLAVGKNEFGQSTENWNFSTLAGAGGIRSSTADMIKYLSAQLGFTQTPLMQAFELTHHKRHEKYLVRRGDNPLGMGLGWIIATNSDGNNYWHGGSTGGYTSYIGFNKTMQKGVVVLATGYDPSDIGAYLMYSDSLKEIKRSLSTELALKIDLVGPEKAKAFFEDSVINNLQEFSYGSFPLNRLGRIYLKENIDASIAIFEINIKLFPNDWNAYNNYGEALRKKGRLEESLESYQKSVQLNPENQTALNSVTELEEEMGIGQ